MTIVEAENSELTWDETEPLHLFEDGWGIYPLRTMNDRILQKETCTMHCVNMREWDAVRFNQGLTLFTVRDSEGKGRCTILGVDAKRGIKHRAGSDYIAYVTSVIKEIPHPVKFPNGDELIILQIAPEDSIDHDRLISRPVSERVLKWILSLPAPEGPLSEYVANNREVRNYAQEFLRTYPEFKEITTGEIKLR